MLATAVVVAKSWGAKVVSFAHADTCALAREQEQFLFRVYSRLSEWIERLGREPREREGQDADTHKAGVRYLELLRMTVRTTLIKANQGLVRREAWAALARARAAGRRMSAMGLEDLVQEGLIGLMASIDRFDRRRGVRFATYATTAVRRQIDRAIVEKEPLVYLPRHALQSLEQIRTFCRRYRSVHRRVPTDDEIAAATGVSRETLAAIYDIGRRVSEPEDGGDARQEIGRVPDRAAVDALRTIVSMEVEAALREAVESLDELERDVVRWRFGLEGRPEQSQSEIAHRTGLSQQRIVQIESRSLLKILIVARLRGIEERGTDSLRVSLALLADYGIDERDGLVLLRGWIEQSDRFRVPEYLRERLRRLERLGLSRREIGRMLKEDCASIRLSVASRWRDAARR